MSFSCMLLFINNFLDYECSENEFRCKSDDLCVINDYKCDGIVHCSDGEDEQSCNGGKNFCVVYLFFFLILF